MNSAVDFAEEVTQLVRKHGVYVPLPAPAEVHDLNTGEQVAYLWWEEDQKRYRAAFRPPEAG